MINKVVLVGRLVKDPELRRTKTGLPVASFTIAMNRKFSDKGTDYIQCAVFNKPAENLARYCSKGALIGIDGELRSDTYQDKNGITRTSVQVLCSSIQYLESKKPQQQTPTQQFTSMDMIAGDEYDEYLLNMQF